KYIARATKFEIERRKSEPRTEIRKFAYRAESSSGNGRQFQFAWDQQIRVCTAVRTPDPPTQLIQLRQTVGVSAVDDDRVRTRNVDAVFDDRGGDENV